MTIPATPFSLRKLSAAKGRAVLGRASGAAASNSDSRESSAHRSPVRARASALPGGPEGFNDHLHPLPGQGP